MAIGETNNVDLRRGFMLDGQEVTLVTATNRSNDTLVVYALDHDTRMLRDVAARAIETSVGNYGTCMYHSAGGEYYAFVNHTDGVYQQFRLFADGDRVDAELVRSFCVQTQPEGCVADDETGMLYAGEEAYGIWKFAADPDGTAPGDTRPDCEGALAGVVVDDIEGTIVPDVEGLAIADTGAGSGYLIASGQGANAFFVYDREPPHAHVHTFQVWGGGRACLDGVNETDGIDVTTANLGSAFPEGMLVVQDGSNGDPQAAQNFKLIPFELVREPAFREGGDDCHVSDLGGDTQQETLLGDGPERTADFCDRFCSRCAVCYTMPETGFAEGDCHYLSPKPVFEMDDCLAGCAAGLVPQSTGPLVPGWESWECGALDDAL